MFFLFYILLCIAAGVLGGLAGAVAGQAGRGLFGILYAVVALGLFIPSLAVSFRRLHDIDKSAWWLLISVVPAVGGIVLLVFFCLPGTVGPNKFGPDPKALPGGEAAVFS